MLPIFERITKNSVLLVVKIAQNQVFDPVTFKAVAPPLGGTPTGIGENVIFSVFKGVKFAYCRCTAYSKSRFRYSVLISSSWSHWAVYLAEQSASQQCVTP